MRGVPGQQRVGAAVSLVLGARVLLAARPHAGAVGAKGHRGLPVVPVDCLRHGRVGDVGIV